MLHVPVVAVPPQELRMCETYRNSKGGSLCLTCMGRTTCTHQVHGGVCTQCNHVVRADQLPQTSASILEVEEAMRIMRREIEGSDIMM